VNNNAHSKNPQAIALNQAGAPNMVPIPNQGATVSKPVLLLPNTVGKMNPKLHPQPTHINSNTVRMIVAQNTSGIQQLRPAPGAVLNQQMQSLSPVSLSNFQNIRPKSSAKPNRSVRAVHPGGMNKVIIAQPKHMQLTSANQPKTVQIPVHPKTVPMQLKPTQTNIFPNLSTSVNSVLTSPQTVTKVPPIVTKPPQTAISIVSLKAKPTTSNSMLSNFDRTMSQHLLQLEKTDPHLFKSSKLSIGPSLKASKLTTQPPTKTQLPTLQNDKVKLHRQQPKLNESPTTIATSIPTQQTVPSPKLVTPAQVNVQQGIATTKIASNLMPQLLTSLQQQQLQLQLQQHKTKTTETIQLKQQTNLQDLLAKQRLLQQQQQLNQNKQTIKISTTPSTASAIPQLSQQQIIQQLLAAAAQGGQLNLQKQQSLEMFLLQQKLFQVIFTLLTFEVKTNSQRFWL